MHPAPIHPTPAAPAPAAYPPPMATPPVSTPPVATPPAGIAPPSASASDLGYRPPAPPAGGTNPVLADPFGGMSAPAGGYPTTNVSGVGPKVTQFPLEKAAFEVPQEQELMATKVLARVGGEVILAGEVLSSVDSYLARGGHDIHAPEVLAQRNMLVKMRLNQLIELRAVLHEARRKIPADAFEKAIERFDEDFDKNVVPQMLKDRKLADMAALEESLKKEGTTLARTRRDFAETVLFKSWLQQSAEYSKQVTHEEMLEHYQKHIADYEFIAECKWEQLTARFDKFPSKAEAYQNLAHWGNEIILGRPWAEVAKKHSQGVTASQGGAFSWTKKGSLVSKQIDEAIFSLPVGSLSPILEDETGFHIVRAVERKDGGRTPFTEAQGAIKKSILEERSEAARKEYVAKIRKNAIVWNAFDDPATAPDFTPKAIASPRPPVRR
jgi:hypothetical protein